MPLDRAKEKKLPVNYVTVGDYVFPEDELFVDVGEVRRQRDREWRSLIEEMLNHSG